MSRLLRKNRRYDVSSAFTQIDFILVLLAVSVLTFVGLRHFETYGRINLLEATFGIAGLLLIDLIQSNRIRLRFEFREFKPERSVPLAGVILMSLMLIQIVSQVPYTIDNVEIALSIVFASVCEEVFFRGLLMSLFIKTEDLVKNKNSFAEDNNKRYSQTIIERFRETSIIGIAGVIFSAFAFALLHQNYYDNPAMLLSVFLGGIAFSIFYYYTRDLSALIIAHFILNLIVVGNWLVML